MKCIDCNFKRPGTIAAEHLNYCQEKVSIKEKLRYYSLKDFEEKLDIKKFEGIKD